LVTCVRARWGVVWICRQPWFVRRRAEGVAANKVSRGRRSPFGAPPRAKMPGTPRQCWSFAAWLHTAV